MMIGFQSAVLLAVLVAAGSVQASPRHRIVCAGSPVPSGWILVDRRWSATRCGAGSPSAPNQLVLEHIAPRRAGERVQACITERVPPGWLEVDRNWRATNRCTRHNSPTVPNVKIIERVR